MSQTIFSIILRAGSSSLYVKHIEQLLKENIYLFTYVCIYLERRVSENERQTEIEIFNLTAVSTPTSDTVID